MNEIHKSCLKYGSDKNYINYVKGANIAAKKYIKSTIIPNQADIGAFDKGIFNLSNLVLLLIKLATSLFAE